MFSGLKTLTSIFGQGTYRTQSRHKTGLTRDSEAFEVWKWNVQEILHYVRTFMYRSVVRTIQKGPLSYLLPGRWKGTYVVTMVFSVTQIRFSTDTHFVNVIS